MRKPASWPVCVLVALGGFASHTCLAQASTDCSTIAEDRARLKCYDEQAAHQKKAAAAASSGAASAAAPAAVSSGAASAGGPAAVSSGAASAAAPSSATSSTAPAAASARPTSPAPAATPAPAAGTATASPSEFGLEAQAVRKKKTASPDQIAGKVAKVTTRPRGAYVITLEDGQVWEETQHTTSSNAPSVGDTVTIKRGLLGSFFLSHDAGLALRVQRIN